MMEHGEEEEYDDNYVPPEYGDATEHQDAPDDVHDGAATGKAAEDQEELDMCPMMTISAGSLSMQGRNAKVKRRS